MKTEFKYEGIHKCEAAVLTCIDFRFWRETIEFIENELEIKSFDFPSLPGAAKAINESEADDSLAMQCINVPVDLHKAGKVVLVNHADCGAYGGVDEFDGDIEMEQKFHEEELRKAKRKILAKYPDVVVVMVYAKLVDGGETVEFRIVE